MVLNTWKQKEKKRKKGMHLLPHYPVHVIFPKKFKLKESESEIPF